MNSLLNLALFKSLGFNTKTDGMEFINQHSKLKRQIMETVDELEETKYLILENIKNDIFPKYNDKKEIFIINIKNEHSQKLSDKKIMQRQLLKDSMKDELRNEIRAELEAEELDEKKIRLMKKYPNAYIEFSANLLEDLGNLENIFSSIIKKIDQNEIDKDIIQIIEKQKIQVEKSIYMLSKSIDIIKKLNT